MVAAMALGRRGFGTTAPNPCVAALVIRDGAIVGRGVTAPGGRPHAEPLALAQAGAAARGATLIVTLEPCSHESPRGRPCVEAILAAGIARVVVACEDPDPRVAGQGIAQLRAAGVEVVSGVLAREALRDHRGHVCRVREGRPSLTLKLAETADGFAASAPGQPRLMITGAAANDWVHVARSMHDAVLVGSGTAAADDPLLTVRLPGLDGRTPVRVVAETRFAFDPGGRLARSAQAHPVLVLTAADVPHDTLARLRDLGVTVARVPMTSVGRLDLAAALHALADRGITRVFCEGGPRFGSSLIAADLVDEVDMLTAPGCLAGQGRPSLSASARAMLGDPNRFTLVEDRPIGNDRLQRYERHHRCSPD